MLSLPLAVRLVVNVAALGTLGYALFRWVVRPAVARVTLSDLAGRLENAFPQFDDTLRSTVNFMDRPIPGSEAMKQKTVAKAAQVAGGVDLNRAVALKPIWQSSAVAVGAVGVVVLLAMLFPDYSGIAFNHLLGGAEPWPKSTEFKFDSDVPPVVAAGQKVNVKIKVTKGTAPRRSCATATTTGGGSRRR